MTWEKLEDWQEPAVGESQEVRNYDGSVLALVTDVCESTNRYIASRTHNGIPPKERADFELLLARFERMEQTCHRIIEKHGSAA